MVESYEAPNHYTVGELRTRISELNLILEGPMNPGVRARYVRLLIEYKNELANRSKS